MTDSDMEKEIVDKGLMYPRITNDEIEEKMKQAKYDCHIVPDTTTTVITAYIVMGHLKFTLATEIMACVDPRNFNAQLGEKYGIEKASKAAKNKLWELEGYRLAYGITNKPVTAKERLGVELEDLLERELKLAAFISTDHFKSLDKEEKALLATQRTLMSDLSNILDIRFKNWKG